MAKSHKGSRKRLKKSKSRSRGSKYQIKKSGRCPEGYFKFSQVMKDSKKYGTKLPYFCAPEHHTTDRSKRKGSRSPRKIKSRSRNRSPRKIKSRSHNKKSSHYRMRDYGFIRQDE